MRSLLLTLASLIATILGGQAAAQTAPAPIAQVPATQTQNPIGPSPAAPQGQPATTPAGGASFQFTLGAGSTDPENLGSALEIVLLMTVLAFAPALVMTMTSFTRIIIVLTFLKRAMSMQDLPPGMVVTGFALFMTMFIMKPVVNDIYDDAYTPYVAGEMDWREAAGVAAGRMNEFMLYQTRSEDISLILELSKTPRPSTPQNTPFHITVPAFILSEIKTAFQMGFVLFLPFVVIDLVISSILVSMGMFTLPPVVVSTPLKLMLFILVGGWDLVVRSVVESYPQV